MLISLPTKKEERKEQWYANNWVLIKKKVENKSKETKTLNIDYPKNDD